MQKLFYPESVMVFGVSSAPTNLARYIVENLDRFGFKGAVYAVGRDGGTLNGRTILKDADSIAGQADLAVILLPARAVPGALEAGGEKGIRYAIILSGGFSEFGDERKDIEGQILEIAGRRKIRFVGPNCLGIVNMENGFAVPFVPVDRQLMRRGSVSLLSQSGGVMLECVKIFSKERIGVSKLISMGNKLDLRESDYLEYLMTDPETKTIVLYLENIADGRRLIDLAGRCEKPIVVLKANRNPSSHEIARFHTSALAGDDLVANSALRQAGIHRVETMQEMVDCARIFSLPVPKGRRLAVLGRSGGFAVILADAVHRYGFELARLSEGFFDLVRRETRAGVIRMTNPLDMGDIFNIDFYVQLMEKALQEKDVDGLVISHTYVVKAELEPSRKIIREAERLCKAYGKPVVFCLITDREHRFLMTPEGDFPVFEDVDHAMKALAKSYDHHRAQSLRAQGRGFKGVGPVRRKGKKIEIAGAEDVFQTLESYGLPAVGQALAASEKEALARARAMGYPVALKTASLEILHKTEAGGVRIHIRGPEELASAFRAMMRNLKKGGYRPGKLLVQKMAPKGQEVFIGGKQDPDFGPVVLFGLGGVFVEVLKDIVIRVAPVNAGTARGMIEEIRGAAVLKGFRGQPPSDVDALVKCIVQVSRLLADHPEIQNLDINPLVVLEKGKGCLIVDAKMDLM